MHRTATKISILSLNKRDKYEYLTGEKILTLQTHMTIQEPKVFFSSLGKGFKKKKKNQGEKVEVLQFLDLNNQQIQSYALDQLKMYSQKTN